MSSTHFRSEDDESFSGEDSGEINHRRESSSLSDIDLETCVVELKAAASSDRDRDNNRDCRICHMGLMSGGGSSGAPIQLGCSCKGDLASAHKKCAETWFKIKGNLTCEICGATALNVGGEHINENNASATTATSTALVAPTPLIIVGTHRFWNGRRIMNFLLACMLFAFIISWLFHFKVLT